MQWVQVGYLYDERGVEDRAYDGQWFRGLAFSDRERRLVQYLMQEHRFQPGTSLGARAWKVARLLTPVDKDSARQAEKDERNLGGSVSENLAGLHTTLRMYKVSHPRNQNGINKFFLF